MLSNSPIPWRACLLLLCLSCCLPAQAKAVPKPAVAADPSEDFGRLAEQRPWTCRGAESAGVPENVPATGWKQVQDDCAWQERLQLRRWTGSGGTRADECVSTQARWWAWARGTQDAPAAWGRHWQVQSLYEEGIGEERIVILRSLGDGRWSLAEWRWRPSPRAATRAWQQVRWNRLADRAAQLRQTTASAAGSVEERRLKAVLAANLGSRAGEISGGMLQWLADGACLLVDAAAPGQQQLQLSYAADDSRLEQRAAMQLQLARRYPKATWLTPFSLVPATPEARSGAKFYAIWQDGAILAGQLWMPTRGDGPLVRVRITTPVPDGHDEAALGRRKKLVERELMALAQRWARSHE